MVDLVCPLGSGSKWQNIELAFALRSFEQHIAGIKDLFIIGEPVSWIRDAHQLPFPDLTHIKEKNIYFKIKHACENPMISDPFLFMNDDHFVVADGSAIQYPYYYWKKIPDILKLRVIQDSYWHALNNTIHALTILKRPMLYYDVHTPILIHKRWFLRVMEQFEWDRVLHGYVVKSLYMNSWYIEGSPRSAPYPMVEMKKDGKYNHPPLEISEAELSSRLVISSGAAHHKKRDWLRWLKAHYQTPSRWENTDRFIIPSSQPETRSASVIGLPDPPAP